MIALDIRIESQAAVARSRWVAATVARMTDGDGLHPTPQAGALFVEMTRVFCAGAWIATLILAQAALDADLEENDSHDGLALNDRRYGRDFIRLRERRNHLVHADGPGPAVTIHSLTQDAAALEREARRAVVLAIRGLAPRT